MHKHAMFLLSSPVDKLWISIRIVLSLVFSASIALGSTHELEQTPPLTAQIEPLVGENFAYGVFQCWPLASSTKPRGILCIVLHPHHGHAATFAEPRSWVEFAHAHDCALVGLSFANAEVADNSWGRARLGSGRALLAALTEFSRRGAGGMDSAPIIIAGVCEAGQYAYEFAGEYPERTAAFITIGGSQHNLALAKEAAAIPALLIATPDRGEGATANIISLFAKGRTLDAPWGLASEPIALYDNADNCELAAVFLVLVSIHLSSDNSMVTKLSLTDGTLLPLKTSQNEAIVLSHLGIASWKAAEMLGKTEAWYPNSSFARMCMYSKPCGDMARALPFPSQEIKPICQSSPARIDLPEMRSDAQATMRRFAFEILVPDANASIDVHVLDVPRIQRVCITKIAEGHWQVVGEIDLLGMPTGSFKFELPVRLFRPEGVVPGGISVLVSGSVRGDIVANVQAVNFGSVKAGGVAKSELILTSLSGKHMKLRNILSSTDSGLSAANVTASGDQLSLRLEMPVENTALLGSTFSGYVLLQVQSSEEQTVKLLYYGSVNQHAVDNP